MYLRHFKKEKPLLNKLQQLHQFDAMMTADDKLTSDRPLSTWIFAANDFHRIKTHFQVKRKPFTLGSISFWFQGHLFIAFLSFYVLTFLSRKSELLIFHSGLIFRTFQNIFPPIFFKIIFAWDSVMKQFWAFEVESIKTKSKIKYWMGLEMFVLKRIVEK